MKTRVAIAASKTISESTNRFTDAERLDWLQKKYGSKTWRLTGWISGTDDIRVAIDDSIERDAANEAIPFDAEKSPK